MNERFQEAVRRFDDANGQDPRRVAVDGGGAQPLELAYARWLSAWVLRLRPEASEALQLAARAQHLRRWEIARETFPATRAGYLKWREELKWLHAQHAGEILREVGYPEPEVARVQALIRKSLFPVDPEARVLEDALCLVFLERQLAELAAKKPESTVVNALRKSWAKMTEQGRAEALKLPYGERVQRLLQLALAAPGPMP